MSPKRARFLVRLYPRAWRARFGAEFQTFLESREVSLLEALDIGRSAIVERLREGWRQLLLLSALAAVFTFIAEVGLYTGLERVPRAVWLVWGLIEIPAAILCVPAIRGSGAALCAKLRSWWWLLACDLASLFLQRDWSQATGLVCIVLGSSQTTLAKEKRGIALLAVSMVTIALTAVGWGLLYRGIAPGGHAQWVLIPLPLFTVAEALQSARRNFAGR